MFDDELVAGIYDAMIDWPKRLAHEGPFFRRLFGRIDARRVLDAACGSGRHAAMFHSWGLEVEAADISPAMIARAKAMFGQSGSESGNEAGRQECPPHWVVRGFSEPVLPQAPFDAAVCIGNSLALVPDLSTAEAAIQQMLAAVRPGGLLIVQLLNLWRLPDGPCTWQKCQRAKLPFSSPLPSGEGQGAGDDPAPPPAMEVLILKGVHRCGTRGYVDLAVADLARTKLLHTESAPLLGLETSALEAMARNAGARKIALFGGYNEGPFNWQESMDVVMVGER
jgi:SAM-dependent methyltransferase